MLDTLRREGHFSDSTSLLIASVCFWISHLHVVLPELKELNFNQKSKVIHFVLLYCECVY